MKRLRVPELVLGFLLGFASLLIIFLLSSDLAVHDLVIALDAHNGIITAIATGFIAWFTLSLRQSTDKLWDAGERQLHHIQSEAAAGEVHRAAQFEQIAEQIEALKQSAEYAEATSHETQRLVWTAEDTARRQLRAYVGHKPGGALFEPVLIKSAQGEIGLHDIGPVKYFEMNHGQTPADNVEMHVCIIEGTDAPERFSGPFKKQKVMRTIHPKRGIGKIVGTEKREEAFFLYGYVDYDDCFGGKWRRRFAFAHHARTGQLPTEDEWVAHHEHNDEIPQPDDRAPPT